MIVLAVIQLAEKKGRGHPAVADISGVPNLFGVCVYSFMCHHSLPSLITPIRNKSRLTAVLAGDYILILVFYAILSFTGIFTFSSIEDLYTLNFQPNECGRQVITHVKVCAEGVVGERGCGGGGVGDWERWRRGGWLWLNCLCGSSIYVCVCVYVCV